MARTVKLYKLPTEHQTPGMRPMKPEDVPQVTRLLAQYLKKFGLHPHLTEDEVGLHPHLMEDEVGGRLA